MMRRPNSFSIIFAFFLLILTPSLAAAELITEAFEIPHQISNSDRIVIGNVSGIAVYDTYTIYTITVSEWLYNPLPENTLIVRTEIGTNASLEDEAEFTKNESVLLMLIGQRSDEGVFRLLDGYAGKRPVSDRDAVIKELKAQGKTETETQLANKTIIANTTEIIATQKPTSSPQMLGELEKENRTKNMTENTTVYIDKVPFVSPFWAVAMMLIAVIYTKRQK